MQNISNTLNTEADYENLSIDSTLIKIHQHSAGAKRGDRTRNQPADLEKPWWAIYIQLSVNNINDSTLTIDVLSHVELQDNNVLGDKACGTAAVRKYITSKEAVYMIPSKVNTWNCDFHIYKELHLVECFFNKLKQLTRVAIRYDKLASPFMAFIHIASILILSKYHS